MPANLKPDIHPGLAEFKAIATSAAAEGITRYPVYCEMMVDNVSPSSLHDALCKDHRISALLESIPSTNSVGRYSYLCLAPTRTIRVESGSGNQGNDAIAWAEAALRGQRSQRSLWTREHPDFCGGLVGYVSYDAVQQLEPRVARALADPLGLPVAMYLEYDAVTAIDHTRQSLKFVAMCDVAAHGGDAEAAWNAGVARAHALCNEVCGVLASSPCSLSPSALPISAVSRARAVDELQKLVSNMGRERYEAVVEELKDRIRAGDIIQAVPSQRCAYVSKVASGDVYRELRTMNPSSYMFHLRLGDAELIGCSPEMVVQLAGNQITTHPIAGTRPRGATPTADDALANELLNDEKERAEHVMLVDLARNDVGRVAEGGSVSVDRLMFVAKYSHVMHIVSEVSGTLGEGHSCFDVLRALFPAGTVSGAPKIRAMELISDAEGELRGPYGGVVGYFGYDGNMDTALTIRTLVRKGDTFYLQAGAGVVYDSVPAAEYMETINKMAAMFQAILQAEQRAECASDGGAAAKRARIS